MELTGCLFRLMADLASPHSTVLLFIKFLILGASFHLPLLFPFIAQQSGKLVGRCMQQMGSGNRLFTFRK